MVFMGGVSQRVDLHSSFIWEGSLGGVMGGVSQRVDLHSSFIWEGSLGGVHGRCLTRVSGFSGMGIVEWWNSGTVEWWNGFFPA